ncbi:hypothetical protein [uncultured Bacteroides sp.]|uniref:hypothetical protein n=1 Tax=uncultured Bacteroides sp. TaxID=162156 RepID=UPI0025DC85DC|nr:hypothetical protein [uncultured Bacteroides sp.]
MRKTERLKKLRQPLPEERKKIDTSINGDAERLIEEQKIVEKHLYPLRIDNRTVIYVPKEKCTPEYTEMKRRKMNPVPEPALQKGGNAHVKVDVEELRSLIQSGMYLKDIAKKLGVSKTTVDKYIQKYGLRKTNEEIAERNKSLK